MKLGLPGPEQVARPVQPLQQSQKSVGEARPPGIAMYSASQNVDVPVAHVVKETPWGPLTLREQAEQRSGNTRRGSVAQRTVVKARDGVARELAPTSSCGFMRCQKKRESEKEGVRERVRKRQGGREGGREASLTVWFPYRAYMPVVPCRLRRRSKVSGSRFDPTSSHEECTAGPLLKWRMDVRRKESDREFRETEASDQESSKQSAVQAATALFSLWCSMNGSQSNNSPKPTLGEAEPAEHAILPAERGAGSGRRCMFGSDRQSAKRCGRCGSGPCIRDTSLRSPF